MRVLGLDPGLRYTGWGLIEASGNRLRFLACGRIAVPEKLEMAERLAFLHRELEKVLAETKPDTAAVEETFSNVNAKSTLKLGMARGIVMAAPALAQISVAEYPANVVKKTVTGAGHADKEQIQRMVKILLPQAHFESADAADALAVAICHAHHAQTAQKTKVGIKA
jgi:crossover junction endodeoxyribonuclease RuvC